MHSEASFPFPSHRPLRVLRVDSSARSSGSNSRALADRLIEKLEAAGELEVTHRDLGASALPFVDEAWIGANFTDESERTDEQRRVLELSDELIEELAYADVLVLAVPLYNFNIPASLKAWVDLIARARKTFRYTESGPRGLLDGKTAYLLMASGGTEVGGDLDFASGYLRHILGFVGIEDVRLVAADQLMARGEDALEDALREVEAMVA